MRITLYISTVLLFIATVITGWLAYSYSQIQLVSASSIVLSEQAEDDTHYSNPICENFEELTKEESTPEFELDVTYALDQNKHKGDSPQYSSTSSEAYDPETMTTKEKVEYLLRCQKSSVI